jgi:hypothetical protein
MRKTRKQLEPKEFKHKTKRQLDHEIKQTLSSPPSVPKTTTPDPVTRVREAVTTMPASGRFGDKVFISEIWHRVGRQVAPSLAAFKSWLVDQNRRGALILARADLIGALDPKKVAESEIKDRNATFHFVLDPNRSW